MKNQPHHAKTKGKRAASAQAPAAALNGIEPEMNITALAGFLGLPGATTRDILVAAGMSNVGKHPVSESTRIILNHFRGKSGKIDQERASAQRRQAIADADNAELETVKRRREFQAVARELFSEGMVQIKQKIEGAIYLKPDQKAKMHADVHSVVLPTDGEEG